jgi:hypothetical protein
MPVGYWGRTYLSFVGTGESRHCSTSEVCRNLGLMKNSCERLESMRKSASDACSRRTSRIDPMLMREGYSPRYISTSPVSMKRNHSISHVVQSVGMDGFARIRSSGSPRRIRFPPRMIGCPGIGSRDLRMAIGRSVSEEIERLEQCLTDPGVCVE